jgi:large subunit ribosomal protein L21
MYAVIESGGQQHKVQVNATVTVDRLAVPEGAMVQFNRVLLLSGDGDTQVGTPTVADAVVRGRVVKHLRGPKIRGFTYEPKKRYRRRFGHRSELTQVLIEAIETEAAKVEEEPETAAVEEAPAEVAVGPVEEEPEVAAAVERALAAVATTVEIDAATEETDEAAATEADAEEAEEN